MKKPRKLLITWKLVEGEILEYRENITYKSHFRSCIYKALVVSPTLSHINVHFAPHLI